MLFGIHHHHLHQFWMDGMYGYNDSTTSTSKPGDDDYSDRTGGGLNLIISDPNIFPAIDYLHHYTTTTSSSMLHSDRRFGSDDLAGFHCSAVVSESLSPTVHHHHHHQQQGEVSVCNSMKARIASHPCYPKLIDAYIDCQKVGAPAEIAGLLEEIRREKDQLCNTKYQDLLVPMCLGTDPELDEFMETYYEILVKYKSDLSRPFDEATSFLTNIQAQLGNLCTTKDDGSLSSDGELSGVETEAQDAQSRTEDRELRDKLLRRYGSHISSLKLEFSKKKKKGKLPKESRHALLEWWNVHYKWPYPTEADKISLAESTGLDQKQINNWFINQRKRHWKPSENMQLAIMNNLSGHFFSED